MANPSTNPAVPNRRRDFLLRELLSPPSEVASIAFVWSAAKPLPCQMHWAGHGPTPPSCGQKPTPTHKTRDGQFLWTYASVKNILVEEAYTGVLNNHRREYNNGKAKHIDKTDWYRHEGFFPVIIGKQEWKQVQALLKRQARPANGNQAKHRYAGLLTCRECGNTFIPMIRCWNGKSRVEYVCRGYHRNGKAYCSSHRIHEEVLDAAVQEYAETVRKQCAEELKKLVQMQKMWALRKPILDAHILSLQENMQKLELEIDGIVMEKLKGGVSNPRPR